MEPWKLGAGGNLARTREIKVHEYENPGTSTLACRRRLNEEQTALEHRTLTFQLILTCADYAW
jgi:hypothetical protein